MTLFPWLSDFSLKINISNKSYLNKEKFIYFSEKDFDFFKQNLNEKELSFLSCFSSISKRHEDSSFNLLKSYVYKIRDMVSSGFFNEEDFLSSTSKIVRVNLPDKILDQFLDNGYISYDLDNISISNDKLTIHKFRYKIDTQKELAKIPIGQKVIFKTQLSTSVGFFLGAYTFVNSYEHTRKPEGFILYPAINFLAMDEHGFIYIANSIQPIPDYEIDHSLSSFVIDPKNLLIKYEDNKKYILVDKINSIKSLSVDYFKKPKEDRQSDLNFIIKGIKRL